MASVAKVGSVSESNNGLARELATALVLLALSGGCFGGLVGMLTIAAKALGR